MADRDLISIEPLSEGNFVSWKFKMGLLFEKRDIMDVVEGTLVEPDEKTGEKWKQWKKKRIRGEILHFHSTGRPSNEARPNLQKLQRNVRDSLWPV